jgi:pimeloyl-ACP methyl ester carboxylesterase/DNA-binding CsgD family transcriptional regulator
MEPRTQYARTAKGVNIAFCTAGAGQPLLFLSTPPLSHVQLDWQVPFAMYPPLAQNHRLVAFDWPGTGLSDRDAVDFSMPALIVDIETVVARTGLGRFALYSIGYGAQIAVTFAVKHPEQVSHLILADGWARFEDYRQSAVYQAEMALRGQDWLIYTESYARLVFGFDNQQFARAFAEYHRACVEQDAHRAAYDAMETFDVSQLLSKVAAQTLVVQNRNCPWVSLSVGQRLAAGIPGSRFIVVDDPTYAQMAGLIRDFLAESTPQELSRREIEVLRLLAAGMSSREIGTELSLSARTVERHITNIYHKIGAHGRAQATAYAIEHGVTGPR